MLTWLNGRRIRQQADVVIRIVRYRPVKGFSREGNLEAVKIQSEKSMHLAIACINFLRSNGGVFFFIIVDEIIQHH